MIEQLGLSKVFWIHAVIMFLGNIFVFFAMPETRGLTMTQLNEIFGGKIAYEDESKYGDFEDDDESKEKLHSDKNIIEKTSSVANIAAQKVVSTAALTKVASAAAISRVASYAKSVGGGGKGMWCITFNVQFQKLYFSSVSEKHLLIVLFTFFRKPG